MQKTRDHMQFRRCGFNPWVGKIPWRRKWQPTPVFLPGKSHGQRSLVAIVRGVPRVEHDLATKSRPQCNMITPPVSVNTSFSHIIVVVQLLNYIQHFANSWTATHQLSLSFTVSWSSLKPMPIESMMPSNHLILCHPFSSCPQSFPASGSFPMSQLFTSGGQRINLPFSFCG